MRPEVYAVVAAAGSGTRLGSARPKALVDVAGRSILERCLDGLAASEVIDHAVVTVSADMRDAVDAMVAGQLAVWGAMRVSVVLGGEERTDSVRAGLAEVVSLCGEGADQSRILVAVHDAARCLAPASLVAEVVDAARHGISDDAWGGAVPVLPVTDTVKVVETVHGGRLDGATVIRATPAREHLRSTQTPQVFSLGGLVEAHRMDEARRELDSVHPTGRSAGPVVTDDSSLMELGGHTVLAVPGDRRAFKITWPEDLERAERLTGGTA